jgi:hypothetical protein
MRIERNAFVPCTPAVAWHGFAYSTNFGAYAFSPRFQLWHRTRLHERSFTPGAAAAALGEPYGIFAVLRFFRQAGARSRRMRLADCSITDSPGRVEVPIGRFLEATTSAPPRQHMPVRQREISGISL